MAEKPRIRNNICMNVDPEGLVKFLKRDIAYAESHKRTGGPSYVLVLGCSTGYGLASRIVSAFSYGAATVGVSFERKPSEGKQGTPGFYNNEAFEAEAKKRNISAVTFEGDAFSLAVKNTVIAEAKRAGKKFDLVIYSLATAVRTDERTGESYRSVLKPLHAPYSAKSLDFITGEVKPVTIEPATEEEARATVKVMGGEDWMDWMKSLAEAGVLAEGVTTLAYSYIGPAVTYPIYREGTIGKAKEHLENSAATITNALSNIHGRAYVSVNKALVTRASAVIPVVPLYISILFKVMKQRGTHEGCIEQMERLFSERLYTGGPVPVDEDGRIRIDDREMQSDVQEEVSRLMEHATTENIASIADLEGYRRDFLALHGFESL
ncbi:MAG TPA: trans-2-enoyl-CoA reductase family protein [Spirochaetia bacterium]|nr:trans-2-enoyl-CoA reductase family protein [Spirochaetia bacterium]